MKTCNDNLRNDLHCEKYNLLSRVDHTDGINAISNITDTEISPSSVNSDGNICDSNSNQHTVLLDIPEDNVTSEQGDSLISNHLSTTSQYLHLWSNLVDNRVYGHVNTKSTCRSILWGIVQWIQKTQNDDFEDLESKCDDGCEMKSNFYNIGVHGAVSEDSNNNKVSDAVKNPNHRYFDTEDDPVNETTNKIDDLSLPTSFHSNKEPKSHKRTRRLKPVKSLQDLPRTSFPMEDNIFLSLFSDGLLYPVQIIGLSYVPGCVVIRFVGYDQYDTVLRSKLVKVPVEQREEIYQQIEQDNINDEYSMKPINVDNKYWDQRYRLFSRFDRGIRLDDESWYSVTPEVISMHVASQVHNALSSHFNGKNFIAADCFCGSGGDSIALARHGFTVLSSDIDVTKLEYCRHNSRVYGVSSNLEWTQTSAYSVLSNLDSQVRRQGRHAVDVIVLAPPWGGPQYIEESSYSLRTMITSGDGIELVRLAAKACNNIVYIIPKNSSHQEIYYSACISGLPAVIEDIRLHGNHKIKVVYYGEILYNYFHSKETQQQSQTSTKTKQSKSKKRKRRSEMQQSIEIGQQSQQSDAS